MQLLRWEYQTFKISGGAPGEGLNRIGAEGWEAFHLDHHADGDLVWCRRPKGLVALAGNVGMVIPSKVGTA